jgi:hypothetical protein
MGQAFCLTNSAEGLNGNALLLQEPPRNVVVTRLIIHPEDATYIKILLDIRNLLQIAFPLRI